jgi:O-antigen/teichoic acid export membrane protein
LQFLFVGVIFRTLNRVSDALLRAKDATFRASWIKAIYVLLMAAGTWIALPYGVAYVGLVIAITTMVHYLMGVWMGQRVIGGNFWEVIWVSRYGWLIGIMVTLESLFIHFLISDGIWMTLISGFVMILIYVIIMLKLPFLLGNSEINPLTLLKNRLSIKRL